MGNVASWTLVPTADINMRVPDKMKQCVVFFGLPSLKDGAVRTEYRATGFFVCVPFRVDEKGVGDGFLYLVTAKHVAQNLAGKEFVVRANTKDGKSIAITSPADSEIKWLFHPTDEHADVAVYPWSGSTDANIDYGVVSVKHFLKPEDLRPQGIGIGDEVCIVGLFSFHEGQSKNHPMLRSGNIAMIPDEKVKTKDGPMDAYLIEARSIGGISGSPVFVAAPQVSRVWLLLGLIYGHWDLSASKINDMQDGKKEPQINTGIAIVTPAQKILDIVNGEELSNSRARVIDSVEKLQHPVRD